MASGEKKAFGASIQESLKNFSIGNLKKTDTNVTTAGGESYIETRDSTGKIVQKKLDKKSYGFVGWGIADMQVGEILPGLLLSSQDVALDLETLQKYKVTHILNVASFVDECFPEHFTYKSLKIDDHPDTNIVARFDKAFSFIDQGRKSKNGCVLVHCNAGVSRAATIVIGYVMSREGMTFQHAFNHVKDRRPVIRPNDGFQAQLKAYDETLRNARSKLN